MLFKVTRSAAGGKPGEQDTLITVMIHSEREPNSANLAHVTLEFLLKQLVKYSPSFSMSDSQLGYASLF